jgi:adenylylsulfate kinase-like enzyme
VDRIKSSRFPDTDGFAIEDRLEQARRMGWLCDRVVDAGTYAIADFVCPTAETRCAFGDAFIVWIRRGVYDRLRRYAD